MSSQACRNCGAGNPGAAHFCMNCGAPLERSCANCGAVAPQQARFCMECGASLTTEAVARPPVAPPEERRQVTILFADLSGYTAISENMDPERVKALVDSALHRLASEVDRFGGTVDKYIGDNVMALFGAPVAHEDDAERAVRAGLAMQDAMGEINQQLRESHEVTLALRVGINTGEVVAGAVGDAYTVVGDTVNVAARLQAAAERGSVTVGERTMRASAVAIAYRELPPLVLKGKTEPVPAWQAIRVAAAPRRGRVGARSPLIGRRQELDLMDSLAERVMRERRPHLVTILGEAGVGKSRLLAEFETHLSRARNDVSFRSGSCPAYGSSVVYWALAEVLRAEFGIGDTDGAEEAWRKLTDEVRRRLEQGPDAERHADILGRLLGLGPHQGVAESQADGPQYARESFFAAVRALVEATASDRPLVIAFEDIHWADEGMLDLIEHLARWVRAPLLLLCLTREELLERRPGWGSGGRNATSLALEPLTNTEALELVAALMPGAPDVARIAERSEGNPLFAEEMVQRLSEGANDGDLPDTVQGVLAARLDSLSSFERRVMQHAAVSGRTFWGGSLASLAQDEGADLAGALRALEEKELVLPVRGTSGLAAEQEYAFKHVLVRDVAYSMLPKAVRARRHYEVARYVEERSGDRGEEVAALLAEHYGRAASLAEEVQLERPLREEWSAKAFEQLEAAGDAALRLYSNAEAFDHYAAACATAGGDAAASARVREKQGDAALLLGRVDAAIAAWEECLEFQRRAEDLPRLGELNRKLASALWQKGALKQAIDRLQRGIATLKDGQPTRELVRLYEDAATLYMHTGDNMLAIYAAEKALRLAERLGESAAASRAHEVFGRVFGRTGDSVKARQNLERSVDLARSSGPADTIRALIALGSHLDMSEADYAGASAAYAEARELADRVGDLTATAELHSALALLAAYRAAWDEVSTHAEASLSIAEREGLLRNTAYPYALRALLAWRVGDFAQAEALYRRALSIAEETGWSEVAYWALYGLALALRDAGDASGALTALAQALDVCERAGLIAQSIQATAARSMNLALLEKWEQARELADEAAGLAERLPYPVGRAASLEATGMCADDLDGGVAALREARDAWTALGRPLDATWCDVLMGRKLSGVRPDEARDVLWAAAESFDVLGVPHLADHARSTATVA